MEKPVGVEEGGPPLRVSVVIIGRNEGMRLARCLQSVRSMDLADACYEILYVDSGSSDGSLARARGFGARVFEVEGAPTAARGRNLGLQHARAPFILFLDGDTLVHPDFARKALDFLDQHEDVAVYSGQRREIHPRASIYNRVLDLDWRLPTGYVSLCGGDAMMRGDALRRVGGYREDLIAGEEPELCARLGRAEFRIYCTDEAMTEHDLAITRFSGYWKRCFRAGYAYARVAALTGGEMFGRESRKNHLQAPVYLLSLIGFPLFLEWRGLVLLVVLASLVLARTYLRARRHRASPGTTLLYSIHGHLCQLPIWLGQLRFYRDRLFSRGGAIIEYK